MRRWPGTDYPLGATWDGEGVNFAIFSSAASGVELCLFDAPDAEVESERIPLVERTNHVWHGYFPDLAPGQLYGFRVDGPHDPPAGHRFNGQKLLIDPYARAITSGMRWSDALFGYELDHPDSDLSLSAADSAACMPKCVVVDTAFTWGDDRPPRTPWSRTLIYECHVKGMTARHPGVPEELRGTYLGLASDPIIDHLLALGVTAVELLPVHHFIDERELVQRGLSNYWGYNPIGYFAPDPRYATGDRGEQVREFKSTVKAFHRVGIEVILDVVYNHSAEGNELGPHLGFRGIDNTTYYRLGPGDHRHYADYSGCGNTLDTRNPRVIQMILDSLRYWVNEMHVDGFRFDLAAALGRDPDVFDRASRFFATLQQDPVLAGVKLIAEPWDVGPGGYQVGAFPAGWAEWNGRYRDTVRRFWRGDDGQTSELATRLAGSSDLFQARDREPFASVNFITCHDGFTLRDLTTYERRHNDANPDANHGETNNHSRNWGTEGETESVRINQLRERIQLNFLATLAFSQGVPMLSHGDELGRTQRGNNNAYCQDSELSWVNWELDARGRRILDFVRRVFEIRRSNPAFRRRRFFAGDPVSIEGVADVTWLAPGGRPMEPSDWHDAHNQVLGMLIHGEASDEVDERGRPNVGDTLLLLLNGGGRSRRFKLPQVVAPGGWRELVNTARPSRRTLRTPSVNLVAHSLMLLGDGYGEPR